MLRDPQQWLAQEDISQAVFMCQWITGELKHNIEDVSSLRISQEILRDKKAEELAQDGWTHWKHGNHITFTVTFSDGRQFQKTIEKGEITNVNYR